MCMWSVCVCGRFFLLCARFDVNRLSMKQVTDTLLGQNLYLVCLLADTDSSSDIDCSSLPVRKGHYQIQSSFENKSWANAL